MYLICSGERGRMEKLNKAYNSAQHAVRNFSTLSPAADTNTASAGFPVERPRCHHLTCFSAELWGSFFRTEPWLCGGRETEQRSDRRRQLAEESCRKVPAGGVPSATPSAPSRRQREVCSGTECGDLLVKVCPLYPREPSGELQRLRLALNIWGPWAGSLLYGTPTLRTALLI